MALKTQTSAMGSMPGASAERAWSNELRRGRVPGPRLPQQALVPAGSGPSTMCVHAGTYEDPITGAVAGPLFQTTTFRFSETSYGSFAQGITRDVPIYTRYGNPNQWCVQEKIATLEGAESAAVFASGMGAIFTTLLALTNRGGHVISAYDVYGGTYDLLKELHQMGRSVTFVDPTDLSAIEAALRDETQVLFFETLSNPLLKALPLPEVAALAHQWKALLIVDNTFLSPVFCRPIQHGADLVIHSCTKYLNGHSDLTAGVVSGSRKYVDRVWQQSLRVGAQLEPLSCFLLERGMKTLDVRAQRQAESATQIAAFLSTHPHVARVHHPSQPDYGYRWIDSYCSGGYGGLVSFEVRGGDEAALRVTQSLRVATLATSLGGVESLVSLPFNTSHSALTVKQREQMGIRPGLVRFSVGIENAPDLIADLDRALKEGVEQR